MKERKADLFAMISEDGIDAVCITTNAHFEDGRAAMAGGCAGVCARKWPQTAYRLATCLKNFQINVPFVIGALDANGNYVEPKIKMIRENKYKTLIFSFPTIDNLVDGAKLDLIKQSAQEMKKFADRFQLRNIVLGRPGVGVGGLSWADVKPVIEPILDDRFIIVSFAHEE